MSVHGSTDSSDAGRSMSAGRAADVAHAAQDAAQTGTQRVKRGMADMLKGGVIMDVVTP